jgi:sulfur relay (sulfurtransferase) DsrC/TusE family protein
MDECISKVTQIQEQNHVSVTDDHYKIDEIKDIRKFYTKLGSRLGLHLT